MKVNTPLTRHFEGAKLLQIAMPMGGLGAGCICLDGGGGLRDFSIRHMPANSARPDGHSSGDAGFALLRVQGHKGKAMTKLLEGPMPLGKIYDQGLQAQGYRHGGHEGLPRFERASFEAQYPFGRVHLADSQIPLEVTVSGWSPFIPLDDFHSGLPCAIVEYTLSNPTTQSVDFEFSFHLSHLAAFHSQHGDGENRSASIPASTLGGGVFFHNTRPSQDVEFGSAALYLVGPRPQIKAAWFRGGWFDAISVLWSAVSQGRFECNDGGSFGRDERGGGSVWLQGALGAGESLTLPVVVAWHFPNSNQRFGEQTRTDQYGQGCGEDEAPAWRPFYAGKFADAREVALYMATHYQSLHARTAKFTSALWSSTVPVEVLDAVASNLAIFKSPTVLRQENGNVWAWEGCFTDAGCCPGSCTHVWNYAQAMPHLFPALERTLREQELLRSIDERGHVDFRAALPDGDTSHDFHAAADGQLGGILKLWRDFHICGHKEWLQSLFSTAKKSLDYCIATWDTERSGALFEPHHNTYDIEFWGPDAMCGTIYVGALTALADLADEIGEESTPYRELAARGAAFLDDELFNGEYYFQKVQWEGLRDTSFAAKLAESVVNDELARFQKVEGPKYQYGSGCLRDGVIGAWMARLYGLDTPLNESHVRATLDAIFRHNFKSDLSAHACLQRPGYAIGHEPGLLLCTWPRGGKPTLPFVYSDEVWTGIEYQVASHLILEGRVEEGLSLVRAVRSRYDGLKRNPFDEYECGSYYARAMASYALLPALSGFRYDAVTQKLYFGPRLGYDEEFRAFFSTASGFGTLILTNQNLTVELLEGQLKMASVCLRRGDQIWERAWPITIGAGQSASFTFEPK